MLLLEEVAEPMGLFPSMTLQPFALALFFQFLPITVYQKDQKSPGLCTRGCVSQPSFLRLGERQVALDDSGQSLKFGFGRGLSLRDCTWRCMAHSQGIVWPFPLAESQGVSCK